MTKYLQNIDKSMIAFDKRPRIMAPTGITIHHTGIGERNPDEVSTELWSTLFKNISAYLSREDDKYVSVHYTIARDGSIKEHCDPAKWVTFHAGKSSFWNPIKRKWLDNCNEFFIGIELIGDGNKGSYSIEQYESLGELCSFLVFKFTTIQPQMIQGHEVISPGRKTDPGFLFDWRRFFGEMYKHIALVPDP